MEQFPMEQFLIQHILHSLVLQHSISISKQVVDLNSFNSGDIYLCSLGKFYSFATINVSNIFVFTGIIFDVVLFVQIIIYLLFSVFSIFKNGFLLTNFSSDFIFYKIYINYQRSLNSFMYFYSFLLHKIFKILQFFQYTKI